MNISQSAYRPLRGLAAEVVAADAIESHFGLTATVYGGSRKGFDIEAGDLLVDAKALVALDRSVQRRWPGYTYQVQRDRHSLFDTGAVTHVALVAIDDSAIYTDFRDGELHIRVSGESCAVYLVPTADINELLDPQEGVARKWRYLILEDAWLQPYRLAPAVPTGTSLRDTLVLSDCGPGPS